jgi:hypothetical protein
MRDQSAQVARVKRNAHLNGGSLPKSSGQQWAQSSVQCSGFSVQGAVVGKISSADCRPANSSRCHENHDFAPNDFANQSAATPRAKKLPCEDVAAPRKSSARRQNRRASAQKE